MNHNISVVPQMLARHPEFAAYVLNGFLKHTKSTWIDRRFHPDTASRINLLYFRITPLCNLNCIMCGQRGDKGIFNGPVGFEEAKKIVPIQRYKDLIDEIKDQHPVFYFWGGEPFLYPDFPDLIRHAVDRKCMVAVNTNGTLLARHAEQIVRDGWHSIFVSLDGSEEINDRIRGKGTYQRVMEGFEAINREKKRQGKDLPFMGIVSTVNNINYLHLDKLVEDSGPLDLSWHIINLGTYTNDAVVAANKKELREKLGVESVCLEAFNTGYNEGIDGERFGEILQRIHSLKPGYPIITVPTLNPEKTTEYYAHPEIPVRKECSVPWSQASIDYNGNVNFCADYNEYSLGNILEKPFMEIYNGERAAHFRRELKNSPNGNFSGCLRCYQNMLFGKKMKGY